VETCPAAFVIEGATARDACVLCRVDSTDRGQQHADRGPLAIVRAETSPAAFFGYCLAGRLQRAVELDDELGAFSPPVLRDIADRARNSGARLDYSECPSWRSERDNRMAARLAEQPGRRRAHGAT
jgi:hypothetical protein